MVITSSTQCFSVSASEEDTMQFPLGGNFLAIKSMIDM